MSKSTAKPLQQLTCHCKTCTCKRCPNAAKVTSGSSSRSEKCSHGTKPCPCHRTKCLPCCLNEPEPKPDTEWTHYLMSVMKHYNDTCDCTIVTRALRANVHEYFDLNKCQCQKCKHEQEDAQTNNDVPK